MFRSVKRVYIKGGIVGLLFLCASWAQASNYVIDTDKAHAFVQFKISHLGFSWLYGRFNRFEGAFSYDPANPQASSVSVTVDTSSVDSNHAERDKHLRSEDFLYVDKFPQATFVSHRVDVRESGKAIIYGTLTLRGVSKEVVIDAKRIGGGNDPWGGYREGFSGSTSFRLSDFGIPKKLGPASEEVTLILSIEGIKK